MERPPIGARSYALEWEGGSVRMVVAGRVDIDVRVTHAGQLLVVREPDAPAPAPGTLDVRAHGLWLSLVDEGGGRWTLGLEAFALAVDHPDDDRGDLVALGLDVEFDEGRLFGELLVADEVLALDVPARWTVS